MSAGGVRYEWPLRLRSSPEQLWPLVADTNRFDRDAGTPAVERLVERDAQLTNGRSAVRQRLFGVPLEYEQAPFEWSYPSAFSVSRSYSRGPLARLDVRVRMQAAQAGGTDCRYQVLAVPRNAIGRLAIPVQIGIVFRRTFVKKLQAYDDLIQRGEGWRSTAGAPTLVLGGRERLAEAVGRLGNDALARRLSTFLAEGDDTAVGHIRPYALADVWGSARREVLELFLRAARAGVVAFRWDVLCPLCGVAKASVEHLDELPRVVHCSTCNIDYESNFESSVELAFRVTPAIRKVTNDEYCIGAPTATPHVVTQVLVPSGTSMTVTPELEPGRHRIRCWELPGSRAFRVTDDDADRDLDVVIDAGGWPASEATINTESSLHLRNASDDEQLVLVERTAWNDDAVTAAEVTVLQEFRDLFASEALRPGEKISVGSLTIVFTDLRASTELYRRVGDAVAFGHVLDHFDVLRAAITEHGGSVVKTIGDAVMAAFDRPVAAVAALLDAQRAVGAIQPGGTPLTLKAGVHHGPCIAVTLNGRLDYFGTTVNLAARLEGQAAGDEIVLSEAVRFDPEVAALLAAEPSLSCSPVSTELKGFDGAVIAHLLARPAG